MLAGLTFLVVAAIPFVHTKIPIDEDMFLYWRRSEPSECKPFTTYMVDCNKCVCSADGISYCTRMACFAKDESAEGLEGNEKSNGSATKPMLPASVSHEEDNKSQSPSDRDDSA